MYGSFVNSSIITSKCFNSVNKNIKYTFFACGKTVIIWRPSSPLHFPLVFFHASFYLFFRLFPLSFSCLFCSSRLGFLFSFFSLFFKSSSPLPFLLSLSQSSPPLLSPFLSTNSPLGTRFLSSLHFFLSPFSPLPHSSSFSLSPLFASPSPFTLHPIHFLPFSFCLSPFHIQAHICLSPSPPISLPLSFTITSISSSSLISSFHKLLEIQVAECDLKALYTSFVPPSLPSIPPSFLASHSTLSYSLAFFSLLYFF